MTKEKKICVNWSRPSVGLLLLLSVINIIAGKLNQASAQTLKIDEIVQFELPAAPLTDLQKRKTPDAQNIVQGVFTGRLKIPSGNGPHPAMVVVRTCHDSSYHDPWLNRLNDWGIASLSFSRCQPPDFIPDDAEIPALDWKRGSLASFGALNYLIGRQEIDAKKIGIMSWSRLGMIPLSTLQHEGFAQFFDNKFIAGIAIYPFCSFARGPHTGPILILAGNDDHWIDNNVCKRVADASVEDEFPVTTLMLKDAVHGFDIPAFGSPRRVTSDEINPDKFAAGGGVLGYNEIAASRAFQEVRKFLDKHLR